MLCCMCCVADDDNRIALEALPSEVTGEDEDSDYINAYMGDYINASYIDVSSLPQVCRLSFRNCLFGAAL